MFNYDAYKKELDIIKNEIIDNYNHEKFYEMEEVFSLKISELNKKYKIIFKHNLDSVWREHLEEFYIIDAEKDNIVIYNCEKKKEYVYTIPYKEIKKIRDNIDRNSLLFNKCEIADPPVLDGSSHELYICGNNNDVELTCYNLWYWMDDKAFNDNFDRISKEEIEYTKIVINCIKNIQEILISNKIRYKIL